MSVCICSTTEYIDTRKDKSSSFVSPNAVICSAISLSVLPVVAPVSVFYKSINHFASLYMSYSYYGSSATEGGENLQ